MKNSHESKPNIVHRFINSTLKLAKEHTDQQSKSSVRRFKYELPESFLKAVDRARLAAGYDILPRHRHRSISPSIEQKTSISSSSPVRLDHRDRSKPPISRSSSTNDIDRVVIRKIPFRRTPRTPMPHQTTRPIFIPSRTQFPMVMHPNLLIMHRSPRPILLQQRPRMFRFPF